MKKVARKAYRLFAQNPKHSSLRFKPASHNSNSYSRINIGYRALGMMPQSDEIVWFWIGPHAEYERLIS